MSSRRQILACSAQEPRTLRHTCIWHYRPKLLNQYIWADAISASLTWTGEATVKTWQKIKVFVEVIRLVELQTSRSRIFISDLSRTSRWHRTLARRRLLPSSFLLIFLVLCAWVSWDECRNWIGSKMDAQIRILIHNFPPIQHYAQTDLWTWSLRQSSPTVDVLFTLTTLLPNRSIAEPVLEYGKGLTRRCC